MEFLQSLLPSAVNTHTSGRASVFSVELNGAPSLSPDKRWRRKGGEEGRNSTLDRADEWEGDADL